MRRLQPEHSVEDEDSASLQVVKIGEFVAVPGGFRTRDALLRNRLALLTPATPVWLLLGAPMLELTGQVAVRRLFGMSSNADFSIVADH